MEEEEEMEGKYVHVKVCGRGSFSHADSAQREVDIITARHLTSSPKWWD